VARGADPMPGRHYADDARETVPGSSAYPWFGQPAAPSSPATPMTGPPPPEETETTVVFTRPPDLTTPPRQPSGPPGMPPLHAAETALLPRFLEAPEGPPSLAELARRHGLRPASARPSLGTYIRDLWRCREFILAYANGRTVASFGATRLGRLWQVLTPLLNAGIYFLVFGVILGARRGVDNFVGYLCVGMFIFTATQNAAQYAVSSISGQLGLVRALQFPRASLPIAMVISQLEGVLVSMVVLAGIVVATGEPITVEWVYLAPTLALQFAFNLGLGFILARIGAKIADVRQVLPYVLRVWMYGSAVLYSVELFQAHLPSWAQPIVLANPALVYIELARYSLMENVPLGSPVNQLWIMGAAWALVVGIAGFIYFWRAEAEYGRG